MPVIFNSTSLPVDSNMVAFLNKTLLTPEVKASADKVNASVNDMTHRTRIYARPAGTWLKRLAGVPVNCKYVYYCDYYYYYDAGCNSPRAAWPPPVSWGGGRGQCLFSAAALLCECPLLCHPTLHHTAYGQTQVTRLALLSAPHIFICLCLLSGSPCLSASALVSMSFELLPVVQLV